MRDQPDLDSIFGDAEPVNAPILPTPKKRRKPRKAGMSRDAAKRHAFRVLGLLATLEAKDRERVLKLASQLSKA